ncbi:MAG: alpha/beta fold hydrolase [Bacilli bacterium]|nr:alpha/beta fold hydrolase [Bacilli bacterium]HOE06304.1 alpha/beta fold hydrolase [Bacilli bacterium]
MKRKMLIYLLFCLSLMMNGCKTKVTEHSYQEENIIVTTEEFELPGMLTIPESKDVVPAVVLIHGSGPSNMNEAIGALEPFENLAQELAKKGIASIRYHKRTFVYGSTLANDYSFTIYDEVIDDVLSAIAMLRADKRIDSKNLFLIGHSMGGQLAPIILNLDKNIKGAILLAGTTEHIIDVAMRQLQKQESPYYDTYYSYYEYFRNLKEVVPGEENYFYMGAYEAYWASYNKFELQSEVIEASKHYQLLIMQGGQDLQVPKTTLDDYKNLLKGKENVQYKYYEELNHCFVYGVGENINNAYLIRKKIPTEVIDDIVNFIKK